MDMKLELAPIPVSDVKTIAVCCKQMMQITTKGGR